MSDSMHSIRRSIEQLRDWLLQELHSRSPRNWEELEQLTVCLPVLEDLLARGQLSQCAAELRRIYQLMGLPSEETSPLRILAERPPSSENGQDRDPDESSRGWEDRPRDTRAVPVFDAYRSGPGGQRGSSLSILNRLSQVLSQQQEQVVVHPEVRWPDEVFAQTTFFVYVAAQDRESQYTGEALTLSRKAGRPLDLEVQLKLPESGELQLRSPGSGVLRVDDQGRSAALCFELFAAAPGQHTLEVALRYGGIERTRMGCEIEVSPSPLDPAQAARAEYKRVSCGELPRSEPYYGLLLQFEQTSRSSESATYRVVLSGSAWPDSEIEGEVVLGPDYRSMLNQLLCEITPALKLGSGAVRELQLRNLGRTLAIKVLPPDILAALFDPCWPEGTPLHIECGNLNVPWEMLQPAEGTDRLFLGQHFAVTRNPRLGTPRDVFGGGPSVLVAPRHSNLQSAVDKQALMKLVPKPPTELDKSEPLLLFLRGDVPCGVLHFACHGDSTFGQMLGNKLQLDPGFLFVSDVPKPTRGQKGAVSGALVFINACRANNPLQTFWSEDGWGGAFLRAGAAAVIAPSWSVSDDGAAEVAERFYRRLSTGLSVGEAMRQVRRELGTLYILDHLGYAVLGSPNARFVSRTNAAL